MAYLRNDYCRYIGVEGELWKLREDNPVPSKNRGRRLVLVGIVGLVLICGGAGLVVVLVKASRKAVAVSGRGEHQLPGVKLFDKKVVFASGTVQTVDLRLPCSGLLSINLTFPEGNCLSVFLVPPEERAKMDAGQTFTHVTGLDARTTSGRYRRGARLPGGAYRLFLLNESGSRCVVDVNAHLSDLK